MSAIRLSKTEIKNFIKAEIEAQMKSIGLYGWIAGIS